MASKPLQTRHVLPILAERGLRASRESLAEMSDLLGLRARDIKANWSQRRWQPTDVELMVLGFELRRHWNLGPELFQELVEQGPECAERIVEHLRETLDSFVGKLDAVRQEGRAEAPPVAQAAGTAA